MRNLTQVFPSAAYPVLLDYNLFLASNKWPRLTAKPPAFGKTDGSAWLTEQRRKNAASSLGRDDAGSDQKIIRFAEMRSSGLLSLCEIEN
jgi:hypothetical protein